MWWSHFPYAASVVASMTACDLVYAALVPQRSFWWLLPVCVLYVLTGYGLERLRSKSTVFDDYKFYSTRFVVTCGLIDGLSFFFTPMAFLSIVHWMCLSVQWLLGVIYHVVADFG